MAGVWGPYQAIKNGYTATGAQYGTGPGQVSYNNYLPGMNAALGNAASAYGTQGTTGSQQQQLAAMLLARAQGEGPNLAQQQLANALSQSQRQGASAIASVRGMNPGASARLLLNQQAQQSMGLAGQSAALRMQEEENATGQLGGVLSQERGQDIYAGMAQGQLGAQQGQLETQQNQQALQNSLTTQEINAQIAAANTQREQQASNGNVGFWAGLGSDVLNAVGGIASGGATSAIPAVEGAANMATSSGAGPSVMADVSGASGGPSAAGAGDFSGDASAGMAARGGLVARGRVIPPVARRDQLRRMLAKHSAVDYRSGGRVPGRAAVAGNSYRNDTEQALLSPREIVLPRSVTMAKDAPTKAALFVQHIRQQHGYASGGSVPEEQDRQLFDHLRQRFEHEERVGLSQKLGEMHKRMKRLEKAIGRHARAS